MSAAESGFRNCAEGNAGRFAAVAGPDACVDRPELVDEFRAEALRLGIERVWLQAGRGTRFAFEFDADSPESACSFVTELLGSVYGLNWWADVRATCGAATSPARAQAAAWN